MSISGAVTKIDQLTKNDLLDRVAKTIIEVVGVQAALYTTVVPNPPSMQTSGAVAGGAGVLALVINGILAWAKKSQTKKLDALASAINDAVAVRLAGMRMAPQQAQKSVLTIPEIPAV